MRDTLGAGCARAASGAVTTASKKEGDGRPCHGPDARDAPLRAGVADQTRSARACSMDAGHPRGARASIARSSGLRDPSGPSGRMQT